MSIRSFSVRSGEIFTTNGRCSSAGNKERLSTTYKTKPLHKSNLLLQQLEPSRILYCVKRNYSIKHNIYIMFYRIVSLYIIVFLINMRLLCAGTCNVKEMGIVNVATKILCISRDKQMLQCK